MSKPRAHTCRLPLLGSPEQTSHHIAYLEWGSPQLPPLVCVHGLSRNAHDFDFLARDLESYFHIYCPDMPGRGRSDWLENKLLYNYATYLADCVALLNHWQVESCDWVGTSMGGIIGMMLAAFHPQRIRRLVLNDIGMRVPKEGLKRITSYAGIKTRFSTRAEAEEYLRAAFTPFGIKEESHWQHLLAYSITEKAEDDFRLAYDPDILFGMKQETKNFTEINDVDLSAIWAAVQCPVLLVCGESSDILPKEVAREMVKGKSNVTLLEIPGVGHAPPLMESAQIRPVSHWLRYGEIG